MIYKYGDILASKAPVIVTSVNNSGYITRGISLPVARAYPKFLIQYKEICASRLVKGGTICPIQATQSRMIVAFFSKEDWQFSSKEEWINLGLARLSRLILNQKIKHIAIPAIGTGTGNVQWDTIMGLLQKHLSELDSNIEVYLPR